MRTLTLGLVLVALAGLAACGSSSKSGSNGGATSTVSWPAPKDPMGLARTAGLEPETAEKLAYHVHAHLDVFVNGAKVVVPAGIGIDITNPGVKTFDVDGDKQYGGIDPPCDSPCISPLHTHAVDGILHTESATKKNNTLGQFFTEWDVKLDKNCVATYCKPETPVAVYVNGKQFAGDPRLIPLRNLAEIAVVVGTPPAQIPSAWPQQ